MNEFERCLIRRVTMSGDLTPGNWNFTADILGICATFMEGWTNCADDAMRIPDVPNGAQVRLQQCAADAAGEE